MKRGLSPFWQGFCLYTSPGFWLLVLVRFACGACYGGLLFTRDLFRK